MSSRPEKTMLDGMHFRSALAIGTFAAFLLAGCSATEGPPALMGDYLGESPPGNRAVLFAPGIVSTGFHESTPAFSPDGTEMYFDVMHLAHTYSAIVRFQRFNGRWVGPDVAPFSGEHMDGGAAFSPDGGRLFFASKRPVPGADASGSLDLWYVERMSSGWSDPVHLGDVVNSDSAEVNPALDHNSNLYFASDRPGGEGGHDLYISRLVDGHYSEPQNLGEVVNSGNFETAPFIAPDDSYLIFNLFPTRGSDLEPGLHVSFRSGNATWTEPIPMGELLDLQKPALFARVSPDHKYLFFSSQQVPYLPYSGEPLNYAQIVEMFSGPQNGTGDVYWIDAGIIEQLRARGSK